MSVRDDEVQPPGLGFHGDSDWREIHHLADQMIRIDLDDGVKANYVKFADVLAPIK